MPNIPVARKILALFKESWNKAIPSQCCSIYVMVTVRVGKVIPNSLSKQPNSIDQTFTYREKKSLSENRMLPLLHIRFSSESRNCDDKLSILIAFSLTGESEWGKMVKFYSVVISLWLYSRKLSRNRLYADCLVQKSILLTRPSNEPFIFSHNSIQWVSYKSIQCALAHAIILIRNPYRHCTVQGMIFCI